MNLYVNTGNLARLIQDASSSRSTSRLTIGYVGMDRAGERWFLVTLTERQVRSILRKLGPGSNLPREYESR